MIASGSARSPVFPTYARMRRAGTVVLFLAVIAGAEPVVIRGGQVPSLLGTPVGRIRLCTGEGIPLPLQIDEVTGAIREANRTDESHLVHPSTQLARAAGRRRPAGA